MGITKTLAYYRKTYNDQGVCIKATGGGSPCRIPPPPTANENEPTPRDGAGGPDDEPQGNDNAAGTSNEGDNNMQVDDDVYDCEDEELRGRRGGNRDLAGDSDMETSDTE